MARSQRQRRRFVFGVLSIVLTVGFAIRGLLLGRHSIHSISILTTGTSSRGQARAAVIRALDTANHNNTTGCININTPASVTPVTASATAPTKKKKQRPMYYYKQYPNDTINDTINSFQGVQARAFEKWTHPFPCQDGKGLTLCEKDRGGASQEGFHYLKTVKTASSTAASVHIRMARSVAVRQNETFGLCDGRMWHNFAHQHFPNLEPTKSFLWTTVRDPTSRLVSLFFFDGVSRGKQEPTAQAFKTFLQKTQHETKPHYFDRLSTVDPRILNQTFDPVQLANKIMQDYNFIAVTERMDESMVVLAMLLDLPLADVLYLNAKGQGSFDDGRSTTTGRCVYILPTFYTKGFDDYFRTEEGQQRVRWDHAIHQAANRSLDLTIEKLGRGEFHANLIRYRQAIQLASERCSDRTIMPCSADGKFTPTEQSDCLWIDSGCGFDCLDEVATELNLWYPHEALNLTLPRGPDYAKIVGRCRGVVGGRQKTAARVALRNQTLRNVNIMPPPPKKAKV